MILEARYYVVRVPGTIFKIIVSIARYLDIASDFLFDVFWTSELASLMRWVTEPFICDWRRSLS